MTKRFRFFCIAALLILGLLCLPACAEADALPRISITTVNQSANALDFVLNPVADHVSARIATWTPNYVFPPAPYYESCTITVSDGADVSLLQAEAAVKVRGNWTTTYRKKPLRIQFTEPQSMLDLNGGAKMKNWVLLAEYKDGSMLRNRAALAIADGLLSPLGLYASDTQLVEVDINGEYWGVYLLAEHQQVNPHRVAVAEPEKDYMGTDIGYFVAFDDYAMHEPALNQFTMTYANKAPLIPFDGHGGSGRKQAPTTYGVTIKSDVYSTRQNKFIANYVSDVYRVLYHAAYRDEAYVFNDKYSRIKRTADVTPQEAVERAINVDSLAAVYILNELACDTDVYMSGVFMSADFSADGDPRLTFQAPWDFDSAMGNKDRCADARGFYAANITPDVNGEFETINPWMAVLAYEDWFQQRVREQWTAAYDAGVFHRAIAMIEADATQYAEAFTRNYARWNNLIDNAEFAHELTPASASCQTHHDAVQQLLDWLTARVEFLNGQWHLPAQ